MHDARHGFATTVADAGKAEDRVLMELTGRSRFSMTMDVHAHVEKSKRGSTKVVDELLKREKPPMSAADVKGP